MLERFLLLFPLPHFRSTQLANEPSRGKKEEGEGEKEEAKQLEEKGRRGGKGEEGKSYGEIKRESKRMERGGRRKAPYFLSLPGV